jgi:hypothetical protein
MMRIYMAFPKWDEDIMCIWDGMWISCLVYRLVWGGGGH